MWTPGRASTQLVLQRGGSKARLGHAGGLLLEADNHLVRAGQVNSASTSYVRSGATRRPGSASWPRVRQWVEAVFDTLKGQLDLEAHGGRTLAGVFVRVAQRLLTLTAAIWHNWAISAPTKRSLIA
jgi:hypothetical protein